MKEKSKIAIFEGRKVRRHWDSEKELWYFSVIDVVEILTQTDRPRKYWNDLKTKLSNEGSQVSEKIGQLKMQSSEFSSFRPSPIFFGRVEESLSSVVFG